MSLDRIGIIGAGVSGLSTGIALLMVGKDVTIRAAERPTHTTSSVAAAIWHPFYQKHDDVYLSRAQHTFYTLRSLATDRASGVSMRTLTEYFRDDPGMPWWAHCSPDACRLAENLTPFPYGAAYRMTIPVMDTSFYLAYLMGMFIDLGGRIEQVRVDSPNAWHDSIDAVINCAGFGSTAFGDHSLVASRGIVLRATKHPALAGCWIDDSDAARPTYVVERSCDTILGGFAEDGMLSTTVSGEQVEDIRRRCTALCSAVSALEIIDVGVGFRPKRTSVRLERDRGNPLVVHNYGHGGAGFTLSWGCARDVVAMVGATVNTSPQACDPDVSLRRKEDVPS